MTTDLLTEVTAALEGLGPLGHEPSSLLGLGVLGLGGAASLLMRPRSQADMVTAAAPALGRPGIVRRLTHRHEKPVTVGGVTFDRAWRHVGIVATTGARKSTLLAMLTAQLGVPGIVITGDHAPPLENWTRSVGGWVWTARGGVAWYPWGGPLELAAQRVEYMFPARGDDVGVHRAMFKQAARKAWAAADARGEARTLGQVLDVLPEAAARASQGGQWSRTGQPGCERSSNRSATR